MENRLLYHFGIKEIDILKIIDVVEDKTIVKSDDHGIFVIDTNIIDSPVGNRQAIFSDLEFAKDFALSVISIEIDRLKKVESIVMMMSK